MVSSVSNSKITALPETLSYTALPCFLVNQFKDSDPRQSFNSVPQDRVLLTQLRYCFRCISRVRGKGSFRATKASSDRNLTL